MIHPCDKPCDNKTASGYCATTVCINPQYSNIGTAQYGQGVQKRIITNYEKLIRKTPEEMAAWIADRPVVSEYDENNPQHKAWLDWLKQENL